MQHLFLRKKPRTCRASSRVRAIVGALTAFKRPAVASLALGCVVIVLAVDAPPVAAEADQCKSGYACLWTRRHYDGYGLGGPYRRERELGLHEVGWWYNDVTSSVWNRRRGALYLYDEGREDRKTRSLCIPGGYAVPNLEKYDFEDRISSFRLTKERCPSGSSTGGGWKGY